MEDSSRSIRMIAGGMAVSWILSAAMLPAAALLAYVLKADDRLMQTGMYLIYIIVSAAGGFYIGKKCTARRFLWGIAAGGLYFTTLFCAARIFGSTGNYEAASWIRVLGCCLGGGMLGGMAA